MIECGKCTTYEISEGLEKILADDPEARGRARYLSDAARRATHGANPGTILEFCLKLTEENYLSIARGENGHQEMAFACCFFRLDGSICPLRVAAGKTHGPRAGFESRISMIA